MRRIRYQVAMSLDGYIAGPKGESDWIVMDPEIDFTEIFKQFDTLLIGRRTFRDDGKAGKRDDSGNEDHRFFADAAAERLSGRDDRGRRM